ncbi:anaerobic carbon-monoxide dehydrogenase catalytic subunit [Murimonas intestini]|uniref:Carbon monoxide dehydrogenase n=1 Tax=Murimonas intestini TaxID=1337051 RepID=A0AB73SXF4_9FIRM|nr:anaerobic carbon-monoxide dehydrogenase catalytic subunit [Murimonas intestini]MCR1838731.1 anaerobic carbon-monoxide dehydrogenase catalytic subunit [Murimonas intestini]MCR1864031.1 anaerobic carbon-monoxide dehydrogenase catalytic subunit [Murimonas intestini]MCR1881641.1 anaerobic carbon-monoxide dehydrogenase catalytic subunit [Murimonas intestini]
MGNFKLTTVEEFEAATNRLLETGAKVGADAWQLRVKNQTPHCKFGEQGVCCRICSMGPCRITPKAPRGICGCDVHGIVARNYLKFTAGGSATHSDHGREICHTLYCSSPDGAYKVKDPEKLMKIAKEWGVETEGKDIYDLAHEVAVLGLEEYGKVFGTQRFLKRAPKHTQEIWEREEIAPRAIDREVSCSLHMTHMGCSSLPEALIRQSLRSGLSDGWGGSMAGTEFSDVLFGTPKPIDTEANLGVMEVENVNIVVHGHDPSLSEMICEYADDPEMIAYAKSKGAKGITVSGVCCTSNEVAMRRGIPMAGNFLQQENVVLTGACEAIVVDVQCIFPALGPLSKCFHTKFITTSPIAQMPDSEFIRFNAETAAENAKAIVKAAIDNFENRKPDLVYIPDMKQKATVGYSLEAIVKTLDGVTNSQVDELGTTKPLIECITSGVIRGAVAMVGCNNPKIRPDSAHIELMKKLIANDVIIVASGCSAQAAAKAGLMDKQAKDLCGAGLKRVCELADIPPVLHMGSCVDISRMMNLVAELAKDSGLNISQLPVVGCAPEWMSEKAVSIGNYVVATGIDTYLGVDPYVSGSDKVAELLTSGIRDWVEAAYTVEKDIDKLGDAMMARIEEKRAALGI